MLSQCISAAIPKKHVKKEEKFFFIQIEYIWYDSLCIRESDPAKEICTESIFLENTSMTRD